MIMFPIGELSLVEAIYDFNPASDEDRANLMTLKPVNEWQLLIN